MKKLMLALVVLTCASFPASAGYEGSSNTYSQAFKDHISRQVESKAFADGPVEWVRRVRYEEHRTTPGGYAQASFYTFHTKSFEQQPVRKDRALIEQRFASISSAMTKNHTLKKYTLMVPIPTDLAQTSATSMNYLLNFLAQPADQAHFNRAYTPYSIKQAEKGVTEVKLYTSDKAILILRIDSFREKVFFFLNEY